MLPPGYIKLMKKDEKLNKRIEDFMQIINELKAKRTMLRKAGKNTKILDAKLANSGAKFPEMNPDYIPRD